MRIFVLGALDPEMREIQHVLASRGEVFVNAQVNGKNVASYNAYAADGTSMELTAGAELIRVECLVAGLTYSQAFDHHHQGDAGYLCGPAEYLQGSSLGQVLTFLGLVPTTEQRIICAADHCPSQAYLGLCPGVTPDALAKWRVVTKAAVRRISPAVLEKLINDQYALLRSAEIIHVDGFPVAWLPNSTDETPEASARYNIAFMYQKMEADGRTKVGILNAPAHAITAWMTGCGMNDVYGNPTRGYAGGYL